MSTKQRQNERCLMQESLNTSEKPKFFDRLADLRSQKQKLSRQLRDKEEEIEEQRQKADNLRQELRKAEKSKREVRVTVCSAILLECPEKQQ